MGIWNTKYRQGTKTINDAGTVVSETPLVTVDMRGVAIDKTFEPAYDHLYGKKAGLGTYPDLRTLINGVKDWPSACAITLKKIKGVQ